MKTNLIFDLHDRVQQTTEIRRRRLLNYDDDAPLTADFCGFEVFEFLIFFGSQK